MQPKLGLEYKKNLKTLSLISYYCQECLSAWVDQTLIFRRLSTHAYTSKPENFSSMHFSRFLMEKRTFLEWFFLWMSLNYWSLCSLLLGHHRWIKVQFLYNNKSPTLFKIELDNLSNGRKRFYIVKIQNLYSLWSIQPNLEKIQRNYSFIIAFIYKKIKPFFHPR